MKIIIEMKDNEKGHVENLFKALLVWKTRVNCGGDAALAFHQYNSYEKEIGKEVRGVMMNCGFIGHDVNINDIKIEE